MYYTKAIAKQYQSNIKAISTHEFLFKNESRNNMNEKEKLSYHTRKCQCVASVQRKEFTTASAVYYREQRFAAKNAVVVAVVGGQVSWPSI